MNILDKILSFLFIVSSSVCYCSDHFQETLLGAVGGGNYSYYWLPQPGAVVLHLSSLEGDADLYVSSKNLKPTFDIENHELQSTTCGAELISVPPTYDRPLSIAVYGHPSHEISLYELKIDVFDFGIEKDIDIELEGSRKSRVNPTSLPNVPGKEEHEYEEHSVFWTLLLHMLQVLIDLLVD